MLMLERRSKGVVFEEILLVPWCLLVVRFLQLFVVVVPVVDVDKRVSSLTNKKISCISLCMDVRIHLCVRLI